MNSQNNEDSINFSVIDRPEDPKACLDFSLPSLLEKEPPQQKPSRVEPPQLQKSVQQVFSKIKKKNGASACSILQPDKESNTFLYALERMEKELSFQSQSYNIYEQNANFQTQVIHNNKSKTLSCLKTTKETNKSTNPSANSQPITFNDYYGPLIIDFKKKDNMTKCGEQNKKYQPAKRKKSNSKSKSQLSSDHSEKPNLHKTNISKSKPKEDLQTMLRSKGQSKSSKDYLLPSDFRKSKNKSKVGRGVSKSHSNLKISSQTDTYTSKAFSEYYGTNIDFKNSVAELKEKKQQGSNVNKIKSRQKSKSVKKMHSPRFKASKANVIK